MRKTIAAARYIIGSILTLLLLFSDQGLMAQTLAFPGADGFGRFAKGARANATKQVYVVTNLNDKGPGSFRDAVSTPGRIVVFAVGGIIRLESTVAVAANTTIAGQTAPGYGIVLFNKTVSFSNSSNTICRFLRIRLGATDNSGNDASGLSNGANVILDHMSITWGMDEVFSINWDGKNTAPDNITIQNSIIGQGLHRSNHSAGGLIQTPDGGRVSLLKNLYISNKTRNPKVKGVNEFVNNVVYNWGNGNRLDDNLNYGWSGDAYIMGGSSGVSEVNVLNNYFVGGPLTPPDKTTPFSRGTGTFNIYGAGNYFDNNKNGSLDGTLVPFNSTGYPGIEGEAFKAQAFAYPAANPTLTAQQAYQWIIDSVGACYPRRDQVDSFLLDEVKSYGTKGHYVYRETDMPFGNGGLGAVFSAPAPTDTDGDGMPDVWELANGLNPGNAADATANSIAYPEYLNIEVYINSLITIPPPVFVMPPSGVTLTAASAELPVPGSTIVVNWIDNAANEDYFILERSENGVNYTDITHPAANATSYADNTGLLPNTTYYYRIKAISGSDASSYTTPVSVTTPPIPTAPGLASTPVPSNGFQFAELIAGKVILKWKGTANTEKYIVFFGTTPQALTQKTEITYAGDGVYEISGLTNNTTYYWRIDAINAKGSAVGTTWSFKTAQVIPPGLVGHWAFDEDGLGNQVTDSSIYLNHGVLGLDDDDLNIRIPGKKKSALDFATADASRYVVSIPNKEQLFLDKGSFSISWWMKAAPALIPPGTTSAYLMCKGSITRNATTGATGKRFNIEFKSNQLRFAIDDDGDPTGGKDELATPIAPFYTGDWVHVVAIRDTTERKLKIYANGALMKEQAITKALSGIGESSALILGNIGELEFLASTNTPAPYKGALDDLKIYNYPLTLTEIVTLYYGNASPQKPYSPSHNNMTVDGYSDTLKLTWQGGVNTQKYRLFMGDSPTTLQLVSDSVSLAAPLFAIADVPAQTTYYWRVDAKGGLGTTTGDVWSFTTGAPRGLAAHYALDEASGSDAKDSTVYNNGGVLRDMPNAIWITGKDKNGLGFGKPGATGAIVVPDAPQIRFDKSSFSVSMWVKLPAYSSTAKQDCYLIQKGTFEATTGKWYGVQLKDKTLTFAIDDGVTKVNADVSVAAGTTYDIFNKGWVHIVALRDRSINRIRVYVNGVLAKSVDDAAVTGTIGKSDNLLIGNSAENKSFPDSLDDVRIYNYALSAEAIGKLMNGVPLLTKVSSPTPVAAAVGSGPELVTLGWEDKTGTATSYKLYFGTSPSTLKLEKSGLSVPTFTVDTLTPNTTYYWRVAASTDIETIMGDVWSFTTGQDVTGPKVVTKPFTATLSAKGEAAITAADVNDGSSDEYGIQSVVADKTAFGCADIGLNTVTLTVTDKSGNSNTQTAEVTIVGTKPDKPVIMTMDTIICLDDRITIRSGNTAGAATYQWVLNNGLAPGSSKFQNYDTRTAGKYRLYAISEHSCKSDTSAPVLVNISADTVLTVSDAISISKGTATELIAQGSAGTIRWSPDIAISSLTGNAVNVSPLNATRYVATLTNLLGCKVSRSVMVSVADNLSTSYNKLLTPDADGVNDRLVIKNVNAYPNNRLQIFDYSGKLIYQKNGYNNDWDGKVNGKPVANGTYYFVLTVNTEVKIKGSITIIH